MDDILKLAYALSSHTICGEGNVSVRDGDAMLIKASGTNLDGLGYDDLVRCRFDGKPLEDEEKKPSMEVSFLILSIMLFIREANIGCSCKFAGVCFPG